MTVLTPKHSGSGVDTASQLTADQPEQPVEPATPKSHQPQSGEPSLAEIPQLVPSSIEGLYQIIARAAARAHNSIF